MPGRLGLRQSREHTEGQITMRVLVVDDEIRVADSLAQILMASGHEAEAAYSAEAAMKMAERIKPDAMISDVVMGPVSGVELALHMREHFPECKVLLISGQASVRDFSTAFLARSSAVRFAAKPVEPEKILEFVASCGQPGASGSNGAAGESLPQA